MHWNTLRDIKPWNKIKRNNKKYKDYKRSPIHLRYLLFAWWSPPHLNTECMTHSLNPTLNINFTVDCVKSVSSESNMLNSLSVVRAAVTKRQMTDILAACQHCTDDVLSWREEESVDRDSCSQVTSSDLSGRGKERTCFIWSQSLLLACIANTIKF